jgi:hypothetical protein
VPAIVDDAGDDHELRFARALCTLLDLETGLVATPVAPESLTAAQQLAARLAPLTDPPLPLTEGAPGAELTFVRALLDLFERWAAVHHHEPEAHHHVAGWVGFRLPHKLEHSTLVPLRRPRGELPELMVAHDHHRRGRTGFG